MCEPTTIALASFGLSAAGTAGNYFGQRSAASANTQSAQQSYVENMMQIATRMQQERVAAATKVYQMGMEAADAKASATNRASEMGVSGNTVQALIGNLQGQEDFRENIVRENSNNVIQQLAQQGQSEGTRMEQRIKSVPEPSLASLALSFGKDALGAYNTYSGITRGNKMDAAIRLLRNGGDA